MKKNNYKNILIVIGMLLILVGIIFLVQSKNGHFGKESYGRSYASTTIEFGADFYTTSAQYTGLAANTVVDLYKLVSYAISAFFIFSGIIEITLVLMLIPTEVSVPTNTPTISFNQKDNIPTENENEDIEKNTLDRITASNFEANPIIDEQSSPEIKN